MHAIDMVKGEYIKELLNKGFRDGERGMYEYRPISIQKGIIPNAEGSAQVDLGGTKILVGIKIDVDSPLPDKPGEGNLVTSAELLPLASADYDVGPPSPEAIELARVVDRGIRASEAIDMKSLFIEEEKVWSLFIDIYVLNYDGNLFDASTLAAMAALRSARIPKYEDGKVIREGALPRLKVNSTVTSCTFAKINGKTVLDPNKGEEDIMDSRLTIATDGKYIRAMQKGLSGSMSYKTIEELVDISFDKSKELRNILDKAID